MEWMNNFSRRHFIQGLGSGTLAMALNSSLAGKEKKTVDRFHIGIQEYTFHRWLKSGKLNHLDYPALVKKELGISYVEYWNRPFDGKHTSRKYMGELAALHWSKVYRLPVISIRIFNAYGPRVRTSGAYGAVFGVFFKQKLNNKPLTIVGNGNQSRDFIYVTDVADAFLKAAISKKKNEIYNLGADNPKSISFLAQIIGGKVTFIPNRPGEPKITWANNSKIKNNLKWKPRIKFKNGVELMLKHIKDWKTAPLWSPKSIKYATKSWFKYLGNEK